ncbi:LysR substrate-binding domain-containing protein [Xanthomonas theicola]|nr:LysR substrate-binding domain-containing protein [Xanthomonas theicola]QNH26419.1 hypothetical protein G4Q83_19190 [Xanthomonas theicola]
MEEDSGGIVVPVTFATMLEPLLDIALAGRGSAALPSFIARAHLRSGALEEVLGGRQAQSSVLRLLWPSHRHPLPNVRAFAHFLSTHAPKLLEEP